jgi:hypothetical protein
MKVMFTRDYRDRFSGLFGMSTGLYWSFFEPIRYITAQIRGLGRIEIFHAGKWGN